MSANPARRTRPTPPPAPAKSYKNHGWNLQVVNDPSQDVEHVLIRRGVSNDTLGVMLLKGGSLEFWHNGRMVIRTESFAELFAWVEKLERMGL